MTLRLFYKVIVIENFVKEHTNFLKEQTPEQMLETHRNTVNGFGKEAHVIQWIMLLIIIHIKIVFSINHARTIKWLCTSKEGRLYSASSEGGIFMSLTKISLK